MLSQSHFAFRTNKCSTLKPCKTHESGPLALLTFGMSHQMRPPFFLLAKHRLRRRSDIASMLQHQMKAPCTSQILRQKAFLGGTLTQNFQRLSLTKTPARTALDVQASGRKCQLTGKKANNGYVVTFSHTRNKKLQQVNLQQKRVYWPEGKRWVKLRISTQAIKTLERRGVQAMAKEIGIDLASLPYNDVSDARVNWLKEHHKGYPAQPKKIGTSRRMKNPEKLAASKKKPLQARYVAGGRVLLTRDPRYVAEYQD